MRFDVDVLKAQAASQRTSLTTATTIVAQGQIFLDRAAVDDDAVIASLASWSPTQPLLKLISQLKEQHQAPLRSATSEAPVQAFVNSAVSKLLAVGQDRNRSAHDTHKSGLSVAGAAVPVKPDQTICSGPDAIPSQVDTVLEGKAKFDGQGLAAAAYQVVQRAQQLRSWQPRRSKFVVCTILCNAVIIWQLLFEQASCWSCSGHLRCSSICSSSYNSASLMPDQFFDE